MESSGRSWKAPEWHVKQKKNKLLIIKIKNDIKVLSLPTIRKPTWDQPNQKMAKLKQTLAMFAFFNNSFNQ